MARCSICKFLGAAIGALLAGLLVSSPAQALSVRQVLELRKAGVSDATIRQMIETEMAVARGGGAGRYVTHTAGGRQYVVYYAASPGGAWLTPLEVTGAGPRVSQALGASRGSTTVTPSGSVYALHLASFRKREAALKRAVELNAKGVAARVEAVDLPEKGRWYRVITGRYKSPDQAKAQGDKLSQAGSIGKFVVIAFDTE